MDTKNLSIVKQSFANTVFTHKVQEVAAELQGDKALKVKIANIVLVSLVLIFLILQLIYTNESIYSYVGVALSVIEIIFLIFQLSFNFEEKAGLHKNTALKYLELRDKYRNFIADIMNSRITTKEIRIRRGELQGQYQMICDLAPQTQNKEYQEAQKRLNRKRRVEGEQFTWSSEEIDRFLPEKLRLKK